MSAVGAAAHRIVLAVKEVVLAAECGKQFCQLRGVSLQKVQLEEHLLGADAREPRHQRFELASFAINFQDRKRGLAGIGGGPRGMLPLEPHARRRRIEVAIHKAQPRGQLVTKVLASAR